MSKARALTLSQEENHADETIANKSVDTKAVSLERYKIIKTFTCYRYLFFRQINITDNPNLLTASIVHAVRTLTKSRYKPIHFFFDYARSFMFKSLQTNFNRVAIDYFDKYHPRAPLALSSLE